MACWAQASQVPSGCVGVPHCDEAGGREAPAILPYHRLVGRERQNNASCPEGGERE